jgi:hypothetical protein
VLLWTLGAHFPATNAEKVFASVAWITLLGLGLAALSGFSQGCRWAGSLNVLGMAAVLVLVYEGVVTPIREREADSVSFFRQVQEKVGTQEFVMFGESASEAVWYLNRAGRKIRSVRAPKLKEYFFETPGTLLLAPEKRLLQSPLLQEALIVQAQIQRGTERFILASPKPNVKPDPAVFKPLKKDGQGESDDTEE